MQRSRETDPASGGNVAFVHIGKTAGTWLRGQLQSNFLPADICPNLFHGQFENLIELRQRYRFFSAHIGFDLARQLADELIVVFRKPEERILSLYHYWREVEDDRERGGPALAKQHNLGDLLELRMPAVISDMHNTQVWQIAHAHDHATRKTYRNDLSDADLLELAIANLDHFSVVGVTENIEALAGQLRERLGLIVDPSAAPLNVTRTKKPAANLSVATQQKIKRAVRLDERLYEHAVQKYGL